jgi:ligand-binding sensor domain-containing protein
MVQKQIIPLILFASLLCAALISAQNGSPVRHWESFTSFNQVTSMVTYKGDIWAATTGGLVQIDPVSSEYHTYTTVDGLGTNQLFCLHVDDQNRLWVGGKGELVNFSDPAHPDAYLFTDRDGGLVEIYDIIHVPGSDTLWLADRLGVTVFLPSPDPGNGLIFDTYSRFGSIDRDTPARKIAVDSGQIWVGTDGGLAVGSRSDIRELKSPLGWQSFRPTIIAGISSDTISGLVTLRDSVYVGTLDGLYRFDRLPNPQFSNLNLFGVRVVIYNMSQTGDSILSNTARGSVYYIDGTYAYIDYSGMPISNTAAGVTDPQGTYWEGNLQYGVYRRGQSGMTSFNVGGAPGNNCRHIAFAQGKVWGAFWDHGLAWQSGGVWHPVAGVNGLINTLGVGPLGELWVGTWGNGVYRILDDSIAHFDTANSSLSGVSENRAYIVISDITASDDAVWFANFRGIDGELSAVNPYQTSQWKSYTFIGGVQADQMTTVAVGQGVVYSGSQNDGIYAIDYGGTPFYSPDDRRFQFNSANSGIGSDIVQKLKIDQFDTLWVGTGYGVSYQALGEIYFSNLLLPTEYGPSTSALAFDGQGSLYAGSDRGVVVHDIATRTFEILNGRNSGLVDDDISDIELNRADGSLWFATRNGGISRMTLPYAQAAQDVKNVLAYPNPFIITFGDEKLRFNYAGQAEVRIFTLSGDLVRDIPINGVWDGTNDAGKPVASGVYIFTLTDQNKKVGRGKILLVRE